MYAQKRPIDNTHIVRERDRRRFRELLAVLSLGIPIGLFLLLFTWQSLEVIRLGREATRLQQRRKEIEDSNKLLRLQLDRLTALDAVEQKAAGLGFARTDPQAIVMVSASDGSTPPAVEALPAATPFELQPPRENAANPVQTQSSTTTAQPSTRGVTPEVRNGVPEAHR